MTLQQPQVHSPGGESPVYHLDFPHNMSGVALSAEELRTVLQQAMPCDITFNIFQEGPNGPTGRGHYVKNPQRTIRVLDEQEGCCGLIRRLLLLEEATVDADSPLVTCVG